MKQWLMAGIAVAILGVAGCSGVAAGSGRNPIAVPAPGPRGEVVRGGVRVSLQLERPVYEPGETIWADVLIENTGQEPVTWVGGGCNIPAFLSLRMGGDPPPSGGADKMNALRQQVVAESRRQDQVQFYDEDDLKLRAKGDARICDASIQEMQLAPGGALKLRAGWDQYVQRGSSRTLAKAGHFPVVARFPMGSMQAPNPVEVSVQVELAEKRPQLISGIAAFDAAMDHRQVKDWYSAHTGTGVAKQEGGQGFIQMVEGWVKAGPELAMAEAAGAPSGGVQLKDGKWVVTMGRKLGPLPQQVIVVVDAETGAVESVGFSDR